VEETDTENGEGMQGECAVMWVGGKCVRICIRTYIYELLVCVMRAMTGFYHPPTPHQITYLEGSVRRLEEEAGPLKEANKNLSAQKDTMLAESTALKNEVSVWEPLLTDLVAMSTPLLPHPGVSLADEDHSTDRTIQ
jgi:FtsZ-binding cell division protein ZapB